MKKEIFIDCWNKSARAVSCWNHLTIFPLIYELFWKYKFGFLFNWKKKKIEILGYFFLPRIAANEQRDLLDITDNLRGQNRKRKLKTDFGDFKKGQVIINKRRWCCETAELNSSGSVTDINLWNYIGINFRANNNIALKKSFDD